jgi:hypothetical protein
MEGMPMEGMPMEGMPMEGMPMEGMPMEGMPMEGEQEGFMGAMWNGVFYNPGQEAAYNQAVLADPTGGQNGGMGAGGGGGGGGGGGLPGLGGGSGPIVHEASPGVPDNFSGTDGVQDTFVFTLGEGNGVGQAFDELTISANAAGADTIMNFNPADGDKIKIFDTDGVTPLNNPLGSNVVALTTAMPGMGPMTLLHVNGTNEVLYSTADSDLDQSTISNSDFTIA